MITAATHFGLHATKHRGVTDTPGTRREKQDAAGHKTASQTDVYNHEPDAYGPAGTGKRPTDLYIHLYNFPESGSPGRIRTSECLSQSQVPYRLATGLYSQLDPILEQVSDIAIDDNGLQMPR